MSLLEWRVRDVAVHQSTVPRGLELTGELLVVR
jgi:hypothetical protein